MKFYIQKKGKLHERLMNSLRVSMTVSRWAIPGTCILILCSFLNHPYYMSVTEIEYRPQQKEMQIACKIFTDDLEDAMKAEYKKQVVLTDEKEKNAKQTLVFAYLQKHLKITVDGKPVTYEMLGYELEQEATWNYLLLKNVSSFKTINVYNDVLYHLRSGQINIIHFKHKGETKSYRLNAPETSTTFSL